MGNGCSKELSIDIVMGLILFIQGGLSLVLPDPVSQKSGTKMIQKKGGTAASKYIKLQ